MSVGYRVSQVSCFPTGSSPPLRSPRMEPPGLPYVLAFVFYIAFFNFAVLNILTGIFVENAMKLCKPNKHELIVERRKREEQDARDLREILNAMDLNGTGCISKDRSMFSHRIHGRRFAWRQPDAERSSRTAEPHTMQRCKVAMWTASSSMMLSSRISHALPVLAGNALSCVGVVCI